VKKKILPSFLMIAMVMTSRGYGDAYTPDTTTTQEQTQQAAPTKPAAEPAPAPQPAADTAEPEDEQETLPEGTEVSKGEPEAHKAAKRRQWQNIALAVGAIAVAIVAIILASKNTGHSKS
jgi:hypothetical protein